MKTSPFSPVTQTAIEAALKAADIIRGGFGTVYEITMKPGRHNVVTTYDKAAEECIISHIRERFPLHHVLAEESGFSGGSEKDSILWIIDPLDGTTNYAHHIPVCTISIAAFQDKKTISGVILQPFTNELFVAESGKGAFLNGSRISASAINSIDGCLCVTSLPYDLSLSPKLDLQRLISLSIQGLTIRNFGSAALALAYVASGKIDAFWMYNLYPWDYAAGQLLIEEAGGMFTNYNPFSIDKIETANILASNQFLHAILKENIQS